MAASALPSLCIQMCVSLCSTAWKAMIMFGQTGMNRDDGTPSEYRVCGRPPLQQDREKTLVGLVSHTPVTWACVHTPHYNYRQQPQLPNPQITHTHHFMWKTHTLSLSQAHSYSVTHRLSLSIGERVYWRGEKSNKVPWRAGEVTAASPNPSTVPMETSVLVYSQVHNYLHPW